ncbi:ATP-binding protein [Streptomyces roseofulvus]|uniref:sensor histidine kinase n=1 Tax=Streptomyces roseofulvus TaxID=33902 RepID=UPI0031FE390E
MSASPTPFRPALIASVLTVAAGGALVGAATSAAPAEVRAPLAWFAVCGVLLLAAAAFAVTWYARTARGLARRAERLAAQVASQDTYAAQRQAAFERETAALKERHEAQSAAEAAAHAARADELVRAQRAEAERLAAGHAAAVAGLEQRLRRAESARSAALAAAANAAGRMQALATSMMADLREMEHRHADEDVLADLLHLDHRTAQAGRLADSVAVLTGARSGRRWPRPIVMESILRGAMGRISGYQRVRLHSTCEAAVAGHAAEGVMHALAELLDNAANFSPPSAEVHVYVEEVPAGVVITVEDSGLTMSDVQLRRAEAAVDAAAQDLAGLSGTRLGLHVVGRLARKHNLSVSFRPSARGGTGVVMMIPQELVTRGTEAAAAPAPAQAAPAPAQAAAPRPLPARTAAPRPVPAAEPETTHESAAEPPAEGTTPGIPLPRRRRGRTLAAQQESSGRAAAEPARKATPRTGEAARARFGGFQSALRGTDGKPAETPATPSSSGAEPTTPSSNDPHSEGNPR